MKQMAIAALGAILLALFGWAGTSIIGNGERLSKVEAGQENLKDWMGRLDGKLDEVLRRLPVK
jgi:hypothetical protein